jgi:uncharacterized membrane protein YwaF
MIKDWFIKFFTYSFNNGGGPTSFSDGLGEGSFGWRHILWIAVIVLFAIGGYYYFRKHPKHEKTIVMIALAALFLVRFTNQTVRAAIGVENPWTQAFPFHMCTVLTFLLPLSVIFDWKAIKTPVYVLSIMGGVITVLLGDYFNDRFLTFFAFEGITAHSLLILVPIVEIAARRYTLDLRDAWKVIPGILVLMGWATLANRVFYKNLDPNYMYLMKNALPFGNEDNFFAFYVLIFLAFFAAIYAAPLARFVRERISCQQRRLTERP